MNNKEVNDYWFDEIKNMTTEELIARILFLGGNFLKLRSDALDSYVEVNYHGWTIKASGTNIESAYRHALDGIYFVKEEFKDNTPNTIVAI